MLTRKELFLGKRTVYCHRQPGLPETCSNTRWAVIAYFWTLIKDSVCCEADQAGCYSVHNVLHAKKVKSGGIRTFRQKRWTLSLNQSHHQWPASSQANMSLSNSGVYYAAASDQQAAASRTAAQQQQQQQQAQARLYPTTTQQQQYARTQQLTAAQYQQQRTQQQTRDQQNQAFTDRIRLEVNIKDISCTSLSSFPPPLL